MQQTAWKESFIPKVSDSTEAITWESSSLLWKQVTRQPRRQIYSLSLKKCLWMDRHVRETDKKKNKTTELFSCKMCFVVQVVIFKNVQVSQLLNFLFKCGGFFFIKPWKCSMTMTNTVQLWSVYVSGSGECESCPESRLLAFHTYT